MVNTASQPVPAGGRRSGAPREASVEGEPDGPSPAAEPLRPTAPKGIRNPRPAVSVVVPTHDRVTGLARCLAALARQVVDTKLEIIVVDDASAAADAVRRVVGAHAAARLVRLDQDVGPAAARNAGVRAARGSVVLFTDDDCEPDSSWAQRLVDRLGTRADAVGGRTVDGAGTRFSTASQAIAEYVAEQAVGDDDQASFVASNNLGCTDDLLCAVPFDEGFREPAGEDRDWCARVRAAGYSLAVEAGAVVIHHQELSARRFWRQHYRYGRAAYRVRRNGAIDGMESPGFYAGLLRAGFAQGASIGVAVCAAQVATVAGFARQAIAERLPSRAV